MQPPLFRLKSHVHQIPYHNFTLRKTNMNNASVSYLSLNHLRTMVDLPADIIFNILSRLPIRSLCLLKCVSKQFLSLITDPNFIKQHLNHNKNQNKDQIISLGKFFSDLYSLVIITLEPHSSDLTPVHLNSPYKLNLRRIWGSCDGLVLASNYLGSPLFLVNPSTRDILKVPQSPSFILSENTFNTYALGYHSSAEDYVIARVSMQQKPCFITDKNGTDKPYFAVNMLSVYSLKTNLWRMISDCPYKYFRYEDGIFFKGAFHWVAQGAIVSLHVASESFCAVPLPRLGDECAHIDRLSVSKGCLWGTTYQPEHIEFWVMKEYGVRDSWTKFKVQFSHFHPLCFLSTGKILMRSVSGLLSIYDIKSETCEKIQIEGLPELFPAVTYVDSLVQLPRHEN